MELDGHGSVEEVACRHIAKTIVELRRFVGDMNVDGSEKLNLAGYLMDMLLISADREQSDEIYAP